MQTGRLKEPRKPHVLVQANTAASSNLGLQKLEGTLTSAYTPVSLPQITSVDIWPATARGFCVYLAYILHDAGD